jgi:PEP-CTERM motif
MQRCILEVPKRRFIRKNPTTELTIFGNFRTLKSHALNLYMNSKTIKQIATVAALVATALTSQASGYNNFDGTYPSLSSFSDNGFVLYGPSEKDGHIGAVDQAASFSLTLPAGTDLILSAVSIGIQVNGGSSQPSFDGRGDLELELAADNGGLPGSIIATSSPLYLGTYGKQIFTDTFTGAHKLLPNTKYWIIAHPLDTFDGSWNQNSTGDNNPSAGSSDAGATWAIHSSEPNFSLRVGGELTRSSVPEPSSLACVGVMALGAMAFLRNRKRA